jgi:putative ABC transport system substrate-binding protein
MIRRREFIAGLGGAAAWPLAARAQQRLTPVIGVVLNGAAETSAGNVAAFRKGLEETGYVEGQNVIVERYWLEGEYDRLPAQMADLVRRRVAVIVAAGTAAALAAKAATTTIPIVFRVGTDPVATGLVASLNWPGANVTGSTALTSELSPKQLQLLRELVPKAAVFGVLADPVFPDTQSVQIR